MLNGFLQQNELDGFKYSSVAILIVAVTYSQHCLIGLPIEREKCVKE